MGFRARETIGAVPFKKIFLTPFSFVFLWFVHENAPNKFCSSMVYPLKMHRMEESPVFVPLIPLIQHMGFRAREIDC
jgi:hypothetical protein